MAAIISGNFHLGEHGLEFEDKTKIFNIAKGAHRMTVQNWMKQPVGSLTLYNSASKKIVWSDTGLKFTKNGANYDATLNMPINFESVYLVLVFETAQTSGTPSFAIY